MPFYKIALISSIPSEEDYLPFHLELQKIALEKCNLQVDLLKNGEFIYYLGKGSSNLFYRGEPFYPDLYSLAVVRLAIKAAHGGDHYVIREFERRGIPVINPSQALLRTKDKLATLQILANKGLPVTPTAVVRNRDQIELALSMAGNPPYIIKNCFGSGGRCVLQASNVGQVYAIFDYIWQVDRNEILLIQPYLGSNPVADVRAIYFHYKLWRAIVRLAKEGEFRANIKAGATPQVTELTQEEDAICQEAVRSTGLILAGIDFLRTDQGPVILEVNGCPGFTGISSAYSSQGLNLIEELASLLLEYIQNFGTGRKTL